MPYIIVKLQQGEPEWLEWRSQGIGASDAPAIMGENPWKTPSDLLEEKCNGKKTVSNAAMIRGAALEPEARAQYEARVGVQMVPTCLQSTQYDWLRASLDGLAANGSSAVEIKCGESVYRKAATYLKVPEYYFGQLQHILAVTNLRSIDFYCYLPKRPPVHFSVARDDSYITRLIETERLFWEQVQNKRAG
ncbi:MAG: lambda-exonuclease family protein [Nitrospiria bacterium]